MGSWGGLGYNPEHSQIGVKLKEGVGALHFICNSVGPMKYFRSWSHPEDYFIDLPVHVKIRKEVLVHVGPKSHSLFAMPSAPLSDIMRWLQRVSFSQQLGVRRLLWGLRMGNWD